MLRLEITLPDVWLRSHLDAEPYRDDSSGVDLLVELAPSLAEVPAADWDALIGQDDPFVEHAFLRALEVSESVGRDAGWLPLHVLVRREADGALLGALPLYAKDNSWGEFIFDFAWARASQQLGAPYYPKLVSMAPFTPATGCRLLVHPDAEREAIVSALVAGARAAADEIEASSVHLLFVTEAERREVQRHGLRPRLSMQFHWENEGYETWDDYLATFRSSKRKQVRKERRGVAESGLTVRLVRGPDLEEDEWRALRRFYEDNCRRHGSQTYLRPAFFDELRRTAPERVLAAMAFREGEPVAASLNFQKGRHLYGRYWGCREDHEFLHFELCYYRLIEHAIAEGLSHFEAGAQGFHKLKRGMRPARVHSAHWVREPRLAAAIDDFLPREAADVERDMHCLLERTPFHRG